MREEKVKVSKLKDFRISLDLGESCQIKISTGRIYFFELSDALLRFNSGVLLPDETAPSSDGVKRPGLGIIAACLRYTQNHPEKKLLIAAHTDTVGSNAANVKLSAIRADAVQGILLGERDRFATACYGPHLTQEQRYPDGGSGRKKGVLWDDYSDVLKWVSVHFGWPCAYPGQQSTLWGGTRQFQESYNASTVGSADKPISENGVFDKKTWGAVFDCYEFKLAELLETDATGLQTIRKEIKFAIDNGGCRYVACGESKPVDHTGQNNYQSQTNRRVELMFMDEDEEPGLPCTGGACNPQQCPLEPQVNIPIPPTTPPVIPPGPTEPPIGMPDTPSGEYDGPEVLEISLETDFNLCAPARFRVSRYGDVPPTELDKQNIRWSVRDQDGVEYLISHSEIIKEIGEVLNIDMIPIEWKDNVIEIGAAFDSQPQEVVVSLLPQSCTLLDWIGLVQKAEAEFPHLTGVEMTNAMRRIAWYDDEKFRRMYGDSPQGAALTGGTNFTQADINQLIAMTRHSVSAGVESGIVRDPLGYDLAAGHVLTGISSGVYRNRTSADPTPAWTQGLLGEKMDNLYGTTIAGDLGQVAVFVNEGEQAAPYLGIHGDATYAELVGDIDGFLIGDAEAFGGSGRKLSEILLSYYATPRFTPGYLFRMKDFNSSGTAQLLDQTKRFANTYKYKPWDIDIAGGVTEGSDGWGDWIDGKIGQILGGADGATSEVDTECSEACAEFMEWLGREVTKESLVNN